MTYTVSSGTLNPTQLNSVRLQMLLVGKWSVAGHNHRKVICQDLICADLHDMAQRSPCVTREIESWLSDSRVSYTEADDQSSLHCVAVLTRAMSDHIGRHNASSGGGWSKTSASMSHFGWASGVWSIGAMSWANNLEQNCVLQTES